MSVGEVRDLIQKALLRVLDADQIEIGSALGEALLWIEDENGDEFQVSVTQSRPKVE